MIKNVFILLCISQLSYAQDYVANWVSVPLEPGVINYQVQKSLDKINWITVATFQPKKSRDSNRYSYLLPEATAYYRIKVLMTKVVITAIPRRVVNTNVVISKAAVVMNSDSDRLTFTASNESEVAWYYIERLSSSSSSWIVAGKLAQSGKKNYTVNISRVGSNRKYRVRAVYKNNLTSPYINF